eukprot:TRINITY_DN2227_c0_g1_i1.p1 TRINITY_DN2227_c0_g1~~TRINITY_DN2227_c0_g1_i1.p1  ORF type:complete len:432 (-),score=40.73 TRINITY_DN2227_c0_g1_i1:21-1205(-)
MMTISSCQFVVSYKQLGKIKLKGYRKKRVANKSIQYFLAKDEANVKQQTQHAGKTQVVDEIKEVHLNGQHPGRIDSRYFKEDRSVGFWRDHSFFPFEDGPNVDSVEGLKKLREDLLKTFVSARIFRNETSALYWSYHVVRTTLFLGLVTASFVVLGAVSLLSNQSQNQKKPIKYQNQDVKIGKQGMDSEKFLGQTVIWNSVEAIFAFQQDLKNIENGLYKLPWDMTTLQHHQYNPQFIAQQSVNYVQEAVNILTRNRNFNQQPPLWLDSNLYPDYYQNTFHYQTDGWMSSKSAQIYDTQTEVVFAGMQDVTLRHTLIPIHNWLKNNKKQLQNMRALEVAAGTGRFATFFKDNYPDIHLTVSELSPFYLEQARKNMDEWYNLRMNKNSNQQSHAS